MGPSRELQALRDAVLGEHADQVLTPEQRRAIAARAGSPGSTTGEDATPAGLRPLVEKISRWAYKVTQEDLDALRAAGFSEEQLYEATVAAALGAAWSRLDAGLRALDAAAKEPTS